MKGRFWYILAFLTCPCHALLIAFILAGSATGAFISNNLGPVFIALAVIFGLSLYMGSRANRPRTFGRNQERFSPSTPAQGVSHDV